MKDYPESFDEFAEENKIVDYKEVYTLGDELIPITRVKWWLEWWQDKKFKKGHWIKIGAYQGKCSCCNNCVIDEDENFGDYCRHCGAKMEGEQDVV